MRKNGVFNVLSPAHNEKKSNKKNIQLSLLNLCDANFFLKHKIIDTICSKVNNSKVQLVKETAKEKNSYNSLKREKTIIFRKMKKILKFGTILTV